MSEIQTPILDEVIFIDKPLNWTSFDIVAKVRSYYSKKLGHKVKVGHAGTLDPLATGLLIVLVGKATKRQDSYMKKDKQYEVEMILGQTSTTDDGEGQKTIVSESQPSEKDVQTAVTQYLGDIKQIPPAYSAIKIDGKRAYKMARAGQDVQIKPRQVTIHSIEEIKYQYPKLCFTTNVSSGTYIRSLARDIGDTLGVGAYMSALRRTGIGDFNVKDAKQIEDIV